MSATSVGDVMSHRLVTIGPDEPLSVALDAMAEARVRRLPVVAAENGDSRLLGIVSDRDIRLAADSPYLGHPVAEVADGLHRLRVADVMTASPIVVDRETPVATAAQLMLAHRVGGLPVVERDGHTAFVVGLLTRSDLLRLLVELDTQGEG